MAVGSTVDVSATAVRGRADGGVNVTAVGRRAGGGVVDVTAVGGRAGHGVVDVDVTAVEGRACGGVVDVTAVGGRAGGGVINVTAVEERAGSAAGAAVSSDSNVVVSGTALVAEAGVVGCASMEQRHGSTGYILTV